MSDRVSERRRAAQLARHYRDQENLTVAEIARRLGRAPATVKAYLYDPTGEKAREVKARYRGVCRGCGASTSARNRYVPRHISVVLFPNQKCGRG
jgi:predicted transcriptional regulator